MKNISMQRKLKEFFQAFFDFFVPKFTPPVLDFFLGKILENEKKIDRACKLKKKGTKKM